MSKQAAKTKFPTPLLEEAVTKISSHEKIDKIATHFQAIMEILGLDLQDESLARTPYRVAKMYVNEVFQGLNYDAFPDVKLFDGMKCDASRLVFTEVTFVSFCEHHFVPMMGTVYIGYIPHDKIFGLSKISRIVRYFAARPQLQERLTAQIADCLSHFLGHEDVAVSITAQHTCVVARGAKDEQAETTTHYMSGVFQASSDRRREFLDMRATSRK